MWPFSKRTKFHDVSEQYSDESDDIHEESSFSSEISAENSVSYVASNSDSALSSNYEYDCNDENNDETLLKNRFLKVLKHVENVGASEFAISGSLSDAPIHAISIKENQKIIRFPLFEDDLTSIIDVFKQSPYGKGTETIIDASFRNSWHLDPDEFVIMNPKWNVYLNSVLVPRIRKEMAITTSFEASLYKLLLYKSGSFFKPHRDTEKEERMFATLVIQLPSRFNGGQLVIEHDKKTKTIDFGSNVEAGNEFVTFFSSFYCDCKHEILPVTDGIRVCLVYNLVMDETSVTNVPTAPYSSDIETQMASMCDEWRKFPNASPAKIVYGLSHKYTERSISFDSLKSTDKIVANAFVKLSKELSLAVFLGTLEKTWEGDECFLKEKYEDEVQINYQLKRLEMIGASNGKIHKFKTMSVDYDQEVIPKDSFRNLEPFDKQKEETGNEGTILSLSYRHSALVVYPVENIVDILIDEGTNEEAKTIFLDEYKKFTSGSQNDAIKKKLLKWGHKIIQPSPWQREAISLPLLQAITGLNDLSLLQKFLENHILTVESVLPIVEQCNKFGWSALSKQLVNMFKKLKQEAAVKILDQFVGNPVDFADKEEKKKVCLNFMDVLPTLNTENRYMKADFLHSFCVTAKRINYDPLNHLKKQRVEVIVPVLVKLASSNTNKMLDQFYVAVAIHFLDKMKSLDTGSDQTPVWIRNDSISCGCEDCAVLSTFMKSNTKTTNFRIIKKRRLHLEKVVNGLDKLTYTTEPSGRPPTMVVSKTEPSSYTASEEQIVARKLLSSLTAILR